jgi:hypothetical protein
MDNLFQAKKFIQRALDAEHVDVIRENLKMVDWFLAQELEERRGESDRGSTIKAATTL